MSGFGSAKVPLSRWNGLAELTGRTTFALLYDAQELSFLQGPIPFPPPASLVLDARKKWGEARKGAERSSDTLAHWIDRWTDQGRRILLVGFSLGAWVIWEAIQKSKRGDQIDVILICGATGDTQECWRATDDIGQLVNVYSRKDLALKVVYPRVVSGRETPAAGIGPLVRKSDNIVAVDATHRVGSDHLWASNHLSELVVLGLGALWAETVSLEIPHLTDAVLTDAAVGRLLTWVRLDPDLEAEVLEDIGRRKPRGVAAAVDRWSTRGRLEDLMQLAHVQEIISSSDVDSDSPMRHFRGLVRRWLSDGAY